MIFPAFSVTLIGLVVGGIVAANTGHPMRPLPLGILGAWIGFIAGALFGVGIDALAQTGVWVGIVGHVAAVPGAIAATRSELLNP